MRIVIDLQGAQAANRKRGIGRYTLAFAQALEQMCGTHDVILALNDAFPESLPIIRRAFRSILPAENIRVWRSLTSVNALDDTNRSRARAGELIREAFLAALRPDVIVVTSLFEGPGDDAVTSVGLLHNIPTTCSEEKPR